MIKNSSIGIELLLNQSLILFIFSFSYFFIFLFLEAKPFFRISVSFLNCTPFLDIVYIRSFPKTVE